MYTIVYTIKNEENNLVTKEVTDLTLQEAIEYCVVYSDSSWLSTHMYDQSDYGRLVYEA